METATEMQVRLMRAVPKVANRLYRKALEGAARERSMGLMDADDTYNNTRSALAHLLVHDHFRTKNESEINDKLTELIALTRQMLSRPDVHLISKDPGWAARLAAMTDNLERMGKKEIDPRRFAVQRDDVALFLTVINILRKCYLDEEYDPAEVISPSMYALAQMIEANYKAYEATLNS